MALQIRIEEDTSLAATTGFDNYCMTNSCTSRREGIRRKFDSLLKLEQEDSVNLKD